MRFDDVDIVDQSFVETRYSPVDSLTEEQRAVFKESDALLAEIFDADIIVISVAVYNFGLPASLKAWIDQVFNGIFYIECS